MYVIGGLGDQIAFYVWPKISETFFRIANAHIANHLPYRDIFQGFTAPWFSTQPLLWTPVSLLLTIFGVNFIIFFILFTTILNLYCSYLLFRRFRFWLFYSLIFAFSSFYFLHLGPHMDLMQLWVFPLFMHFYLTIHRDQRFRFSKSIFLGLYILLVFLISNYFALYIAIFYVLLSIIGYLIRRFFRFKPDQRRLGGMLISIVTVGLLVLSGYVFLKKNKLLMEVSTRSYEDYFVFSSRPWYFVLPSPKNPLLGNISNRAYRLIDNTGYFLADDYFHLEHSANYLGMLFLITCTFFGVFAFKKSKQKTKSALLIYLFVCLSVFFLTMPPYFTLLGVRIYTPGQLLYMFFPLFRVTARMSVLIHLGLLLLCATSVDALVRLKLVNSKYVKTFLSIVLVVTMTEVYIPPKILKFDKEPEVYKSLGLLGKTSSRFAVYPYSKTREALFWLPVHQKLLINMREYSDEDVVSVEFTERLPTDSGVKDFGDMGGEYLVVFKNIPEADLVFFKNNDALELVGDYSDSYLFTYRVR